MRSLAAMITALVLALGSGLFLAVDAVQAPPAHAAGNHPLPEATKKKTPKAKATATPTPASPTPTARQRTALDEEGERWVQLAVIAGGGLLGAVLVFFAIGALLRRRPRADRE